MATARHTLFPADSLRRPLTLHTIPKSVLLEFQSSWGAVGWPSATARHAQFRVFRFPRDFRFHSPAADPNDEIATSDCRCQISGLRPSRDARARLHKSCQALDMARWAEHMPIRHSAWLRHAKTCKRQASFMSPWRLRILRSRDENLCRVGFSPGRILAGSWWWQAGQNCELALDK